MDDEKLAFMKKHDFGFLFSIDGPKDIQDRNRPLHGGGSSFDVVAPMIPKFLKAYPNLTFRATFDREDKDTLIPTHKFAIEQGYNNIFCIPNNLSDWSQQDLEDMKKQLHELVNYWMDIFRQGKSIAFMPLDRAFNSLARIKEARAKGLHRHGAERLGYGKCGTGATGFVSVTHKGDLYACQELVVDSPEFHVGDIYKGVDDKKRLFLAQQFDVTKVRSSAEGRCASCLLDPICSGYCVANNFIGSGDWHVLPEASCVYYETAVIEMERMYEVMAREGNKLFKQFHDRIVKNKSH